MSRLTIQSNISSLNAQRNFNKVTASLSDSFIRLSSGLRINKASDDAAGLSISESLKADSRIGNQGIRNLNDGLSTLAIADGALTELSGLTARLRELATQSSNAVLSFKQRQALDQEAQSLALEYHRIVKTAEFNGQKVFSGSFGSLKLAAGGNGTPNSMVVSGLGGGVGDGSFTGPTSFGTGTVIESMITGDFDNDGHLDVITADMTSNSISVLLGNGNGTFKARMSILGGTQPKSLKIADLNRDGFLDIISSNGTTGELNVYLGNGNGTFKARSSFTAGANPSWVSIGDFNGDNIIDLVSADTNSNTLSIFLGNGDASFKARVSYVTGTTVNSVVVGDLNNDGHLDLVSPNYSSSFDVFLGNGDGTFKSRLNNPHPPNTPYMATLGDFNNDGILDVATAIYNNGAVGISLGNGDGTFRAHYTYATASTPEHISIGDLNGDGISDLVVAELNSPTHIGILMGNGDGSFQARVSYYVGAGAYSRFVEAVDIDQDGVLDILSANSGAASIGVLLGNKNDGLGALQKFSLKTMLDSQSAMTYLGGVYSRITKQRGQIGAFESRVGVALNVLKTNVLNYNEANSRITDIDVGEESSRLVSNKILQQAAGSVLAQANQQPALVRKLLAEL